MPEIADEQLRTAVKDYFNKVVELYRLGNTETTYNKPISELFELFGCMPIDTSGARSGGSGENPDLTLWRENDDINAMPPFGVVEVKIVGKIREPREKEQLKKEINKFGNVIWTNNNRWEFYLSGNENMVNGFILIQKDETGLKLDETKIDLLIQAIKDFVRIDPVNIKSSTRLAFYMAEYAKSIRATIKGILQADDTKPMYNDLTALHTKLRETLLPELDVDKFADMYAQTIVYGLFIARYNDKTIEDFSLGEAIIGLSEESHLLKQFFQHITNTGNLHQTLRFAIEKLCEIFKLTNIVELLDNNEEKDPVIHFYEEFLAYYDPIQRKEFGAYYTPVQVVRYIIGAVDNALKTEFDIADGLIDNSTMEITVKCDPYPVRIKGRTIDKDEKVISVSKVAILDPACGTGTFGAGVINFIKDKYFSGGNATFYKDWIQEPRGLLSRLIGFEIMMTSYVVAHLKIRRAIAETLGEQPDEHLPSNIFLTNSLAKPMTLREVNTERSLFDFSGAISDEAISADKWKARRPIMAIIGNPPYLASSKNVYDISAYKYEVDGITKLKEKNPKWLNDDYVKFIHFAQQHIDRDGKGILAFITGNGYLDNVTFRGMRASLLRSFDKIHILNLHGHTTKDVAPDGERDENVFDITMGVAIIIAVKTSHSEEWAKVYYADLYGARTDKFEALDNCDINFNEISIDTRTALFIPQDSEKAPEYNDGVSLVDLFKLSSAGMVLGRDSLCVQNIREKVEDIIYRFQIDTPEDLRLRYELGRDTDWTVKGAKDDIERQDGKITKIAYRVFDDRWTYYTGRPNGFYCRPRSDVMNNFMHDEKHNIGLCFTRQDKSPRSYSMIFITDKITESCVLTTQTAGIATIAPLFIAPRELEEEWLPNFDSEYLKTLTQNLDEIPTPIEIFDYCYGVLYDPNYRAMYNEFLKREYPRIPIIKDENTFDKYKIAGQRLRNLHLMLTDVKLDLAINGDNHKIEKSKYKEGILQINDETTITGIPQDVWDYYIGGYQVIDKWFKSHKGEVFNYDKFMHIQKVAGIIVETINIQKRMS